MKIVEVWATIHYKLDNGEEIKATVDREGWYQEYSGDRYEEGDKSFNLWNAAATITGQINAKLRDFFRGCKYENAETLPVTPDNG